MSDILLTNNPSYNQAGKEEVYDKTQKQMSSYLQHSRNAYKGKKL
jgi:hypothetical protein